MSAPTHLARIVVVGTPGAGKSTLAAQLAQRLAVPFLELDTLFWLPNWQPRPPAVFRAAVAEAIAVPAWTAGGNYGVARDLLWARATTLIWLDYPLAISFSRLLRRSLRRIITREVLWAGNCETWRNVFFSRDSVLWFALSSHQRRRRQFSAWLAAPDAAHLHVLRFGQPDALARWYQTPDSAS